MKRARTRADLPHAVRTQPSRDAEALHEMEAPLGVAAMASSLQAERLRELNEHLAGFADPRLRALLAELGEGGVMLGESLARATWLLRQPSSSRAAAAVASARLPLATVLQRALRLPLARFSEPRMACSLDVEAGLASPGSPSAWAQVLSGLIANSALHGFAGRTTGQIRIAAWRSNCAVLRLTYQDDGVGFSPDARDNAFRRRFTSRADQGSSGLGLCLLRDIVQVQLNGAISLIESPVGAAFAIDVPVCPVRPAG